MRPRRERLERTDDLGLAWSKWADGRLWYLEKGRDFDTSAVLVHDAAENAAAAMGKAVRVFSDKDKPTRALWIQFAEGAIVPGQPCPSCGGTVLSRTHTHFVRCRSCESQFLLLPPEDDDEPLGEDADSANTPRNEIFVGKQPKPPKSGKGAKAPEAPKAPRQRLDPLNLGSYVGVRLSLTEIQADFERYAGYGYHAVSRLPLLLFVNVPLHGGEPIEDPTSPIGRVHKVARTKFEPFTALFAEDLRDRPDEDWDIVLP